MRRHSTALAMAALLLTAAGCSDRDWDEEIVLKIFKEAKMDVGKVTVTAVQDGKQAAQTVNGDNLFFNSCDSNRVRIIPANRGGVYSDVTVTVTSANFANITVTKTIKVPTSSMVEVILGSGTSYAPTDCKPGTTPQLAETGEACKKNSDCEGGRCLFTLSDSGKTYKFGGGYCTTTCLTDPNVCGAANCTGAPGAGEKDCCYSVSDGFGKKVDAVCLKRCTSVKGCRAGEGYQCTPGNNCFPGVK